MIFAHFDVFRLLDLIDLSTRSSTETISHKVRNRIEKMSDYKPEQIVMVMDIIDIRWKHGCLVKEIRSIRLGKRRKGARGSFVFIYSTIALHAKAIRQYIVLAC